MPTDRPFISVRPPLREYTLTTARRARTAVALFVDGFSLSDAMSSKFARAHALYSVGLLALDPRCDPDNGTGPASSAFVRSLVQSPGGGGFPPPLGELVHGAP